MMSAADETRVAIALHGGAGTIERNAMSEELEATYRAFLNDAITRGYDQLREGRSGLDVVVFGAVLGFILRRLFGTGAAAEPRSAGL